MLFREERCTNFPSCKSKQPSVSPNARCSNCGFTSAKHCWRNLNEAQDGLPDCGFGNDPQHPHCQCKCKQAMTCQAKLPDWCLHGLAMNSRESLSMFLWVHVALFLCILRPWMLLWQTSQTNLDKSGARVFDRLFWTQQKFSLSPVFCR